MDKTIVKNWDDLSVYIISGNQYGYTINWNLIYIDIPKTELGVAVRILDALGCNLECEKTIVIDTLEKWEEFQCKICKSSYLYDRNFHEFMEIREDERKNVSIKEVEQKYNVELKILKEGN